MTKQQVSIFLAFNSEKNIAIYFLKYSKGEKYGKGLMKKLKLKDVHCVFELVELAQCGEMSVQKLFSRQQEKTNNAGGDSNSCFAPTEMDSQFFFRETYGPGLII